MVVTVNTLIHFSLKRAGAGLLVGLLLAQPAFAQSSADLGRLIFEPVLLNAEGTAPAVGTAPTIQSKAGNNARSAPDITTADTSTTPDPSTEADGSQIITRAGNGERSANSAETVEAERAAEDARARAAALAAEIANNEARINALITAENTYALSLREQYEALADLQQQSGDHEAAVATLEQAMHIERVNAGLFTLQQMPLVEKIIASHNALGNFAEVNDFHEYLYYIQVRSYAPNDARLLAAKEAWADWNVNSYLREGRSSNFAINMNMGPAASFSRDNDYVAIQNPRTGGFNYVPRNQLPFVLNPYGMSANELYRSSSAYAVPPELLVDERLRRARDLYEEIIEARSNNDVNAEFSAEQKLANIAFLVKRRMDALESANSVGSLGYNSIMQPRMSSPLVSRGYAENRETLEGIATQLEQDTARAPVEAARAWIDAGDWHMGFDRFSRGAQAYRKAWQLLQDANTAPATIEAVFAPRPLIAVPELAIHPYSRRLHGIPAEAELVYQGYIDTTLNVDRNGTVRGVKIVNVSEEVSQRMRSDLLDFLRETRVRPAVIAGETVEQSGLNVRFYYSY